jgi:hypothetical protein
MVLLCFVLLVEREEYWMLELVPSWHPQMWVQVEVLLAEKKFVQQAFLVCLLNFALPAERK